MPKCKDCGDTGKVALLTSVVDCGCPLKLVQQFDPTSVCGHNSHDKISKGGPLAATHVCTYIGGTGHAIGVINGKVYRCDACAAGCCKRIN